MHSIDFHVTEIDFDKCVQLLCINCILCPQNYKRKQCTQIHCENIRLIPF